MSDIKNISKRLERIILPSRRLSKQLKSVDRLARNTRALDTANANLKRLQHSLRMTNSQIHQPLVRANQTTHKALSSANQSFIELAKSLAPVRSHFYEITKKLGELAKRWQEARRQDVTEMAENGWYPNGFTFFYHPNQEIESLDELMTSHIYDNWDEITSKIIELCPNRRDLLENAFELHRSGNYQAAIPLFLSQADGICCEKLKSFLFAGDDAQEKITNFTEENGVNLSTFTDVFLEPFKLKNHHNAGISKSSAKAKSKAPNRNGIIHGHRKHLDYGTEINSLKCFSLLAFVVYVTKELLEEADIQKLNEAG